MMNQDDDGDMEKLLESTSTNVDSIPLPFAKKF